MTTIQALVDRFLGWKLPKTFAPDGGITFKPFAHQAHNSPHWPIGTNLFTADQAREMLEHLLGTAAPLWIIGKQHPDRSEVSMFTTSSDHAANEYERLGWTVRLVHVLPDAEQPPIAWLHTVAQHGGEGEQDQALSFAPDNFPLQGDGVGMFYSIGQPRPLYLRPPTRGVPVNRERLSEGRN